MTPEQQRIAIAEACGWKQNRAGWWKHPTAPEAFYPDYLEDLNAMHEVENHLKQPDEFRQYAKMLGAYNQHTTLATVWTLIHATAAQRAEAFLRTIGKWKE